MTDMRQFIRTTFRRFLAVSLRRFMLLILISGIALGWKVNQAAYQRNTIEAIKNAGGFVIFDNDFDGRSSSNFLERFRCNFVTTIGKVYFQNVVEIDLSGDKVTDDTLAAVAIFEELKRLSVHNTPNVTDSGFSNLANLYKIKYIYLNYVPITNAGFAYLKKMGNVRELILFRTRIRGDGLKELNYGMPHLKKFHMNDIADVDLAHLARLDELQELNLSYCPVTGKGLERTKGFRRLERLDLKGARNFSNAGMAWIRSMSNLRSLDLSGTMITDDGLTHLSDLDKLNNLDLSMNRISDVGVLKLKGLRLLRKLKLIGTQVSDEMILGLNAVNPKLIVLLKPTVADALLPQYAW